MVKLHTQQQQYLREVLPQAVARRVRERGVPLRRRVVPLEGVAAPDLVRLEREVRVELQRVVPTQLGVPARCAAIIV